MELEQQLHAQIAELRASGAMQLSYIFRPEQAFWHRDRAHLMTAVFGGQAAQA
jgi:hypothetical protein